MNVPSQILALVVLTSFAMGAWAEAPSLTLTVSLSQKKIFAVEMKDGEESRFTADILPVNPSRPVEPGIFKPWLMDKEYVSRTWPSMRMKHVIFFNNGINIQSNSKARFFERLSRGNRARGAIIVKSDDGEVIYNKVKEIGKDNTQIIVTR